MYYQNEPGIYVYKREHWIMEGNRLYDVRIKTTYYKTLEDFFRGYNEDIIRRECGYHIGDTKCQHIISQQRTSNRWGRVRYYNQKLCLKINCREHEESIPAFTVTIISEISTPLIVLLAFTENGCMIGKMNTPSGPLMAGRLPIPQIRGEIMTYSSWRRMDRK